MLYYSLHRPVPRLIICLLGQLISAIALKWFIVPLDLYTGGLFGLCQLIRTLLQTYLHLNFGTFDIAGFIFFFLNVPILLFAYKLLGRHLVIKTLICTMAYSLFYSLIPSPAVPVVDDYLTACLLGGIFSGIGGGLVLTCGGSGGGLDIVGLCLNKKGFRFTIGRFSLGFNAVLFTACLFLFSPTIAIYSIIYTFFVSMVLDRAHQQSISIQALIFTRENEQELSRFIMEKLGRGVTCWKGTGAYTGNDVHVLCVCLSKYEIEELLHVVHSIDPHAFLTVQEGARIYGNFSQKLNENR